MDQNFHKYIRRSTRLSDWDYGSNGTYFITICTKAHQSYFGNINNKGQMELSEMGDIAQNNWKYMPIQFNYIKLDAFIIMPNHIHGIIIIDKTDYTFKLNRNALEGLSKENNPMLNDNISRILRWFKGRCTYEIRKLHSDFSWQPRFYDHIIKDLDSFEKIKNYINANPTNWKYDQFFEFDEWKNI